jgi:hypothetical protein
MFMPTIPREGIAALVPSPELRDENNFLKRCEEPH